LWYSTVIAVGLVALVWSAERFVDGASAIAKRAGLTPMLIGLTIVSVGTSAPEILISIMSALAGSGELAVGNALGSNIANVGTGIRYHPLGQQHFAGTRHNLGRSAFVDVRRPRHLVLAL
jgi:Ca2+/Na+ antiporter